MQRIEAFENTCTSIVLAVCLCSAVATGIVLFGHAPPLFNAGVRINHLVTVASFGGLIFVTVILLMSYTSAAAARLRRPVLLAAVTLATVEVMLPLFDRFVVSVPGSTVRGVSYPVHVPGGQFYLDQPNTASPFGFRSPRVEPKQFAGVRVLMLGNSFVVGSGSTFATNYPQALERVLNTGPGVPVSVMSAGVDGFGPVEDRLLYEYLVRQGYRFDVVLLNFYLGGDQTNDVPGTTRDVIAGRAQRVHANPFLRYFYPLNSYLYRFTVALSAASTQRWASGTSAVRQVDATCRQSASFAAFQRERAQANYSASAKQGIDMPFNHQAIRAIAQDAQRNGARFGLVLLPDAGALLRGNRERFSPGTMDWDWIRRSLATDAENTYPVVDLSPAFQDRPEYFRCNDTHWNDRGNVEGSQVVGSFVRQSLLSR